LGPYLLPLPLPFAVALASSFRNFDNHPSDFWERLKMNKLEHEAEKLLRVEEVAALLRVPISWVYRNAGDLRAYRVGKYLRFSWNRVLEGLEACGKPHLLSEAQGHDHKD
jgi:excisionase family DNA binding protein